MAARRYTISLRLLKNISRVSTAMNYQTISLLIVFWCERRGLLRSHSNGDIFTCEDNTLFSHVKIPSFHAKLTWYLIGVFIINKYSVFHFSWSNLNTNFMVCTSAMHRNLLLKCFASFRKSKSGQNK